MYELMKLTGSKFGWKNFSLLFPGPDDRGLSAYLTAFPYCCALCQCLCKQLTEASHVCRFQTMFFPFTLGANCWHFPHRFALGPGVRTNTDNDLLAVSYLWAQIRNYWQDSSVHWLANAITSHLFIILCVFSGFLCKPRKTMMLNYIDLMRLQH